MLASIGVRVFVNWQRLGQCLVLATVGGTILGCRQPEEPPAQAQTQPAAIAVDVAIARRGPLQDDVEYTGSTVPVREVSLRSQVAGQLQQLTVDVGDRVQQGQILAQLDDSLLLGEVDRARAEKAAQRSEVARTESEVNNARIAVERANLELQQARSNVDRLSASLDASIEQARLEAEQTAFDAARLSALAKEGVIPEQQAEQAQNRAKQSQQILLNQQASAGREIDRAKTEAQTAAKLLRSAQAQVAIEQQQVRAARAQVDAQKALISQAKTRQSYAVLKSPLTGKVLQKVSEIGNLVQPGTEILRLGDFSRVKVIVEVSELQISQLKIGQVASVKLDAFPDETLTGVVTRISPSAQSPARLVPVEITLANPREKIGSGLLARVSFSQDRARKIVIPDSALQDNSTVFILKREGQTNSVEARSVSVGDRENGQVEIVSGLSDGDRYVTRSSQPLKEGSLVRTSVLSQTSK